MAIHGVNGYTNETQYLEQFRKAVKKLQTDLPDVLKQTGATTIAVRGKSGVSMASALAMFVDFDLIIVRKEAEFKNCHGHPIEHWGSGTEYAKYVILDDFISTGETCNEIIKTLDQATCVGILTYKHASFISRKTKVLGLFRPFTLDRQQDLKVKEKNIPVFSYEDSSSSVEEISEPTTEVVQFKKEGE